MRVGCLAIIFALAPAPAAVAEFPGGMDVMQYFVGAWTCKVTRAGVPTLDVSVNFVMNSGILREWDDMQIPGRPAPYTISKSISYDSKNGRWVQAQADNNGGWIVSYLKPWTGNTEEWLDEAASNGKLGRNETIRTGANEFAFKGYASPSDTKANLEGTCTRVSTISRP